MRSFLFFHLAVVASLLFVCDTNKLTKSFSKLIGSKPSCKDILKNKGTPDKKNFSEFKNYGYPNFDDKTTKIKLEPRGPLSVLNGFKIPIRLGAEDYCIAGDSDKLKTFFECFGQYEVIGSELDMEGKWVNNTGTIKIQISNLSKGPKLTDSMYEMVFKMGLDKIQNYLDPSKIIGLEIFGGPKGNLKDLKKLKKAWNTAKKYIPLPENAVNKIAEISAREISLPDKIEQVFQLIKKETDAIKASKSSWKEPKNVTKNKEFLVTLTMYARPENNVRATYDTLKPTVTLEEIGTAVNTFITKILK
ncbi:uncharacterized protein LOC100211383 [Hydra vulgaris]|uniref:uncharacterized protein LOC100211383 n=1 Tax=Hydra vulgaris TaxID=6087 RepID=UPI0001925CDD|nr:uncharacterized protein LOC100211383 [Hydra vulgaris]